MLIVSRGTSGPQDFLNIVAKCCASTATVIYSLQNQKWLWKPNQDCSGELYIVFVFCEIILFLYYTKS